MASKASTLIKIFSDASDKEALTPERIIQAVTEFQQLPWIQRLQVFSDQAVVLFELRTGRYLYVSPSILQMTGYGQHEFTDIHFRATLFSDGELDIAIDTSRQMMETLEKAELSRDDWFRVRSTRNTKLKKKDGTWVDHLEQGFVVQMSPSGLPILQMVILSDITGFYVDTGFFYSLSLIDDDDSQKILLSGSVKRNTVALSPRETEIALMISHGETSATISRKLGIRVETVKSHRKAMLEKTGTKNSVDLIRFAFANGLL